MRLTQNEMALEKSTFKSHKRDPKRLLLTFFRLEMEVEVLRKAALR